MIKTGILLCIIITISACSSVNIRTDTQKEARSEPTYQKRYNYWWWGLKGKHSINVREVCEGKSVKQMQAVHRVSDVFMIITTLGIYTPRTARVWCGE